MAKITEIESDSVPLPSRKHRKTSDDHAKKLARELSGVRRRRLFREVLKHLVIVLALNFMLSRMVTQTWLWGYEGKYSSLGKMYNLMVPGQRLFSEEELRLHDGTHPNYPPYLAIDGDVFDVSTNLKTYGPGGAYHLFAGHDASRAFAMNCHPLHMITHDLRGVTEGQLDSMRRWKAFFENNPKYKKIGKIMHRDLDPNLPIPPPCEALVQAPPPNPKYLSQHPK